MKKTTKIATALISALLLTACGGGGSGDNGNKPSGSNNDAGSHQDNVQQDGGVKLSDGFESFESFQGGVGGPALFDHPIRELDLLPLASYAKLAPQINSFQLIQNEPNFAKRSHCEKGSVSLLGAYYEDDINNPKFGSARGEFVFYMSSGIELEDIFNPDAECKYVALFDGHITIDASQEKDAQGGFNSVTEVKLGTSSGYFFDLNEYGDGGFAYKGVIKKVEELTSSTLHKVVTSPMMEIFSPQKNPDGEGYLKTDQATVKHYRYESTSSEENGNQSSTKESSFEVTWSENGNTFVMQYRESIKEGFVGFYYEVYNTKAPTKIVKASWEKEGLTFTYRYTKDGKTQEKVVNVAGS